MIISHDLCDYRKIHFSLSTYISNPLINKCNFFFAKGNVNTYILDSHTKTITCHDERTNLHNNYNKTYTISNTKTFCAITV